MKGTSSTPEQRASTLAGEHFPECETHRREAASVYLAVEHLRRAPASPNDLDMPIGDLLPHLMAHRPPAPGSREALDPEVERGVLHVADESVMKPLLGPAVDSSQWDASTIWVRSLRGVINERVRHSGGCACGAPPSDHEMKRGKKRA